MTESSRELEQETLTNKPLQHCATRGRSKTSAIQVKNQREQRTIFLRNWSQIPTRFYLSIGLHRQLNTFPLLDIGLRISNYN